MPSNITNTISLYLKPWNIESQDVVPLDLFLEYIRDGKWQDIVLPIRLLQGEEYDKAKKKVPSVTISGKFTKREDELLEKHSGYIAIDIDDVEPEDAKQILCPDKYVVAAFTSIGGRGLCVLFHIDGNKHREAFAGISEYLFTNYQIIIDPTSVNPSRARFVSFDPSIYIADSYEKFKQYPKEKPPKKIDKAVFSQDDFEQILKQIVERNLNITQDSYAIWLRIGFAIAWKFGEGGRQYFHIISQYSGKYNPHTCEKQYTACLKHHGTKKESTISTFYYYAKLAGCNLYSERTKIIAYTTSSGKKAGLDEKQIAGNLEKFEGITGAQDIIEQVYRQDIWLDEDSIIDQIEVWIRQHYSLERNELTRYIEDNGKPLTQVDLNDIYIKCKKIFDKLSYDLFERIVNSKFVPSYNPIHRFFKMLREGYSLPVVDFKSGPHLPAETIIKLIRAHFPLVSKLFLTIGTKDADYCLYFGAKWLVGVMSGINSKHSPLMFVLSGNIQNTGKTEWFRRLLPPELMPYYAESKLDAGKDDEILMCQKMIIMDDEMGGKSKKEDKRLKELTSKQVFSLREPYGRNNVDLLRIASLCGTTNENEILHDPTGNRRIIPIHVYSVDQEAYNAVNKRELWAEVQGLYDCGLRWKFTREDIVYLGQDAANFEATVAEAELILKYFKIGDSQQWTATEILMEVEKHTKQRLSLDRISKELKRLGFEQRIIRANGSTKRIYYVEPLFLSNLHPPAPDAEDLPF